MKIKFKKLNKTFEVAEGSVIIRNKNETLDSAVVKILNLSEEDKIEVQPLDMCSLIDDDNRFGETFYMCIDDVSETMECVNPRIYSYELHLVSETKLLEGTILPNLSITNIANEPRTVWYYLNQYLNEYGEKIRVGTDAQNYSWRPRWVFSLDVKDKFDEIQCPEMMWNTPTLREVLNDLMMIGDCIVVLKNNTIKYIDLTEINNDISENEHINYVNQSRSSTDYISELQMDLKNVLQTKLEGVNNSTFTSEYIMFNTDGYIVTDDNFKLITRFPIYKLKHLYMYVTAELYDEDMSVEHWERTVFKKIDLCDFGSDHKNLVLEEKEFYTLDAVVRTNMGAHFNQYSNWGKYQNLSLYYTRGENSIKNFNYLTNAGYLLTTSSNFFSQLLSYLFDGWWRYDANYKNVWFKVEYETTADALFRASKDDTPNNYRVVQDNQTNSYIDAYTQGFMEYQKANRLGNKIKFINARYESDYSNLIKLGDVFDEAIVYQIQYQIYKNHIEVNAQATEGYVLRDYFTGVKAKLRSWKIVDGNEAFERHDLIKYYCELSYNQSIELDLDNFISSNLAGYLGTGATKNTEPTPLKYVFVKTKDSANNYFPSEVNGNNEISYYNLELVERVVGNSLVFDFGFIDNFAAVKMMKQTNEDGTPTYTFDDSLIKFSNQIRGGIPLQDRRYVDDNGEFVNLEIYFSDTTNIPDDIPEVIATRTQGTLYPNFTDDIEIYCRTPLYYESEFTKELHISYDNKKDNKEIIKLSTQFEYYSGDESIKFTEEFLKRQDAICSVIKAELDVYVDGVNISAIEGVNTRVYAETMYGVSNSVGRIRVYAGGPGLYIGQNKQISLKTPDGKEVLSFISKNWNSYLGANTETWIYLNILKDRRKYIYDNTIDQNIIDTI